MRNSKTSLLRTALIGAAALTIGACSTMSESECRAIDWRTIGFEDGVAGYSGDQIAVHRKACGKYGVSTDLTAYQAGREQGLREFCQPANGFRVGSHGYEYAGVCPATLEPAFLRSFESGQRLYTLESRSAAAANQLASRQRELHHIQEDIEHNAVAIISGDSTPEQRAHALVETHELVERAGRTQNEIARLEDEAIRCDQELESYRATLAMNR